MFGIPEYIWMRITNADNSKTATITTDGAKERLDVNTPGDANPTLYQLNLDYDAIGDTVGTTDVSLFLFEGQGLIDFVGLTSGSSNYEAIIKVDGVERLRISMGDLGSSLALSNSGDVPIWADTANKNFRFNPNSGMGFSTSFEILARSTTGTQTIKHITIYRELV